MMSLNANKRVRVLYRLVDIALIAIALFIPYIFRYNFSPILNLNFSEFLFPDFTRYLYLYLVWGGITVALLEKRGLYKTDRYLSIFKEALHVISAVTLPSFIILGGIFFLNIDFFPRSVFMANVIFLILLLSVWRSIKRVFIRNLVKQGFHNFNILFIGYNQVTVQLLLNIEKNPYLGLKVIGYLGMPFFAAQKKITYLGNISEVEKTCKRNYIDEVIITDMDLVKDGYLAIIKMLEKNAIGVKVFPNNIIEWQGQYVGFEHIGNVPLMVLKKGNMHPSMSVSKRLMDIAVSFSLLVILSPMLICIGLLIKLDSRGPIVFSQKRTGRKGRTFNFFKFRSMVHNAEALKADLETSNELKGGVIFKIKQDPRITHVGRFLRKYSLDELPQLFNVFRGDMSLVGPRPFPIEESLRLGYDYVSRLDIKPGITGIAQIRGRSDLSFPQWANLDLLYVKEWSWRLDIEILWKTIPAVLRGKGAY